MEYATIDPQQLSDLGFGTDIFLNGAPSDEDIFSRLTRLSAAIQSLPARLKCVEDQSISDPFDAEIYISLCAKLHQDATRDLNEFKTTVNSAAVIERLKSGNLESCSGATARNCVAQLQLWLALLTDIVEAHGIYQSDGMLVNRRPPAEEAIRVSVSRKAVEYLFGFGVESLVCILREILD